MTQRIKTQALGFVGLVLVCAMIVGLVGVYRESFTDRVEVTLHSDRTGLLLDEGARVRVKGVEVGKVASTEADTDGATIRLAIEPDKASLVPSDAVPMIRATTVFGNKYVDLVVDGAKGAPVADGSQLTVRANTDEINDVFQNAVDVIQTVRPGELNSTLSAVATALDGRGEQLGAYLSELNNYLSALEPSLDPLGRDLVDAGHVTRAYADAAPELLATADQFSTTSRTLVARQGDLKSAIKEIDKAAYSVNGLLVSVENPLESLLRGMLPVSDLLRDYAPGVRCIVDLLLEHEKIFNKTLGGWSPSLAIQVGVIAGQDPFRNPSNLPRFVTGLGPQCVPSIEEDPTPPWVDFDDGTAGTYKENGDLSVAEPPAVLYSEMLRDFLGDSGAAELLGKIAKDQSTAEGVSR